MPFPDTTRTIVTNSVPGYCVKLDYAIKYVCERALLSIILTLIEMYIKNE